MDWRIPTLSLRSVPLAWHRNLMEAVVILLILLLCFKNKKFFNLFIISLEQIGNNL